MTETKSRHDIAQACRNLSYAMLDLSTDFDYYGGFAWTDHAKHVASMAALLNLYAHQLEPKHD